MTKKIYVKTFGCVQNTSDSERIRAYFWDKGCRETDNLEAAELVVINTCIVRESAENRAYGLIEKVKSLKSKNQKNVPKLVVTGCLVGANKVIGLKKRFPVVDEFLPIEKISFEIDPIRNEKRAGLVTISTGCNNYCSFCIVPMARGKEVSRKEGEILAEVDNLISNGFKEVVLIGQNVNSYGSDLKGSTSVSMGKKRFKSMFPQLLSKVAGKNLEKISFVSSNPWDYSDELIEVIAKYKNIDRLLHLPVQSGDDEILKKMSRGYTAEDYLDLIKKIRDKVGGVRFSTDIIVGFPGETEEAFQNTVELCREVGFEIAYINKYSPRKGTVSAKMYSDDVPQKEKRRRWVILDRIVNGRG